MRVLLVDDEALALDRLRALFADIEDVEIVGEARDGMTAHEAILRLAPELVILDVQMPGGTGLRLAADLDPATRPEIVFITAFEHYAPDAFDLEATDYILKPVRFDRLRQAVERARRRRRQRAAAARAGRLAAEIEGLRAAAPPPRDEHALWVPDRDGLRRVPLDLIDWVEAARDYVLLHTDLKCYALRITMAELEAKLAGSALVRVHRSAFVRLPKVVALQRAGRAASVTLADGASVPVGPNYLPAVEAALGLD